MTFVIGFWAGGFVLYAVHGWLEQGVADWFDAIEITLNSAIWPVVIGVQVSAYLADRQ